jgi:hypothetical protein
MEVDMSNYSGPAFPQPIAFSPGGEFVNSEHYGLGGIEVRQYIAIEAMKVIYVESAKHFEKHGCPEGRRDGIANECVAMADAMIRAFNKA